MSWWPFSRKAQPLPPVDWPPRDTSRDWGDDQGWQAGDLARCINDSWPDLARYRGHDPRRGAVLRVSAVISGHAQDGSQGIGLRFQGKPQDMAWACTAFRKIRPDQRAADEQFKAELRDRLKIGVPA